MRKRELRARISDQQTVIAEIRAKWHATQVELARLQGEAATQRRWIYQLTNHMPASSSRASARLAREFPMPQ